MLQEIEKSTEAKTEAKKVIWSILLALEKSNALQQLLIPSCHLNPEMVRMIRETNENIQQAIKDGRKFYFSLKD